MKPVTGGGVVDGGGGDRGGGGSGGGRVRNRRRRKSRGPCRGWRTGSRSWRSRWSRGKMARIAANPDAVRKMDFADLMRDAADAGIVRDARSYVHYRELRNKTSHTYDADRAEKTVSVVHEFLRDVRFLLQELRKRNP